MALGMTVVYREPMAKDGTRAAYYEATGDGAYGAGGYPLAASDFGLSNLKFVEPIGVMVADGSGGTGLVGRWDRTNSKLKLMKGNGAAMFTEAGATDPSTNHKIMLRGIGS